MQTKIFLHFIELLVSFLVASKKHLNAKSKIILRKRDKTTNNKQEKFEIVHCKSKQKHTPYFLTL